MSKKKSLGSSPIGYSSIGVDSFEFIPSISNQTADTESFTTDNSSNFTNESYKGEAGASKATSESVEKKIVSYYLEEHLIEKLKKVADDHKMYYSSLVSMAIELWLEQVNVE